MANQPAGLYDPLKPIRGKKLGDVTARNGDRCDLSAVAVFMLCDNGIGCIWAAGGSLQISTRTLRRLSAPIRSAGVIQIRCFELRSMLIVDCHRLKGGFYCSLEMALSP